MTKTKTDKAAYRRSRRVKRPDKIDRKSDEYVGYTCEVEIFAFVRNHRPLSADKRRSIPKNAKRTKTGAPCLLPADSFIRLADFPDNCDSKLDECFGHTTEVIRRRIAKREMLAKRPMVVDLDLTRTEETPTRKPIPPIPVVSRPENVLVGKQQQQGRSMCQQPWGDRLYHYVAGGVRTGS